MPADRVDFTAPEKLMQRDEIFSIAKIFSDLGIKKIRLTGGEPLIRKDAAEIIQKLSNLPVELTLSTNGILVDKYIDVFKSAEIKSLNISLDSLQAEKFSLITHRDVFDKVYSNIHLLLKYNFHVKVNVVVMRGVNDNELIEFVHWTKDLNLHVRFIEFMPFTGNKWETDQVISHREILETLRHEFDFIKLPDGKHDTTQKFKVIGHTGTFALISTMTEPFCSGCNRLRLTADGRMKNCLFSKEENDLLGAFRNGKEIIAIIKANVHAKKAERGGQFNELSQIKDPQTIQNRSMVAIGG